MRNKRKFIICIIIIAVFLIGIGYASVSNITLKINGTAKATASTFSVSFKDEAPGYNVRPKEQTASNIKVVADTPAKGAKSVKVTVEGLHNEEDLGQAFYKIVNDGDVAVSNIQIFITENEITDLDNPGTPSDEFTNGAFTFYANLDSTKLNPGEETTVSIDAMLNQKIRDVSDSEASCYITLKAIPIAN